MRHFTNLRAQACICLLALSIVLLAASCQQPAESQGSADVAAVPKVETRPASFADIKGGEKVYYENCAACHHHEGRVGPPLIKDAGYFIWAGVSPEELGALLFQPVRIKREGSYMPAFSPEDLSDQEVMELGAWLAGFHEPAAELPQLGDPENGATLYAANCAMCHGANGESTAAGAPLAAIVGELHAHEMSTGTIIGFTYLSTRNNAMPSMPAFSEEDLSDSDLLDIAAFMWNFPPMGPPPAEGGDAPAEGGESAPAEGGEAAPAEGGEGAA
ncbi:MAG: c-type cytochrome [Planctomycetales bacterium]|nr:c-type cytochrome [bacterium]UNM06999.1 MAG: c-type cytochrome [Planctomycetales bacterium]